MAKCELINREVNVTAVYFGGGNKIMKTFPKRIEYDGGTYVFSEGLQLLVHKGQNLVKVFEMTDGYARYRLHNDVSAHSWRLVSITQNT